MKQNQFLALLLAAAVFGMTACDFGTPKPSDDSGTDTQKDTPALTDTQAPVPTDTDAPLPAVTDVPEDTETEAVTGLIMAGATAVAYIVAEGLIDAAAVEKPDEQ